MTDLAAGLPLLAPFLGCPSGVCETWRLRHRLGPANTGGPPTSQAVAGTPAGARTVDNRGAAVLRCCAIELKAALGSAYRDDLCGVPTPVPVSWLVSMRSRTDRLYGALSYSC